MRAGLTTLFSSFALGGCGGPPEPGLTDAGQEVRDAAEEAGVRDGGGQACDGAPPPVERPPLPRCWATAPTWTTQSVDPNGRAGAGIGFAYDPSDRAHLSYRVIDGETSLVRAATNVGGAWQIDEVARDTGAFTSLAIGCAGDLHVAYASFGGTQTIYEASPSAEGWTSAAAAPAHGYGQMAMVVDSTGSAQLAYFHCLDFWTCFPLNNAVAVAAHVDGAWAEEDVAVPSPSRAVDVPAPSGAFLASGPDGWLGLLVLETERVAATGQPTGANLVLWEKQGGRWSRSVVASGDLNIQYRAAMAVADTGAPVVLYVKLPQDLNLRASTASIMLATRGDSGWEAEEIESVTEIPWIADVAVDASGAIDLLYFVGGTVARFATNACGPWESVDIDAPVADAALALDRGGRPSVAYFRGNPESRIDAVLGLWMATLEEEFE